MISKAEAARFLTQATFGTRLEDIQQLQSLGYEGWLESQFLRQGGPHLDYVQQHYNSSNRAGRNEKWWIDVVEGDDQLRQRVAFALSQIFVISDVGYGMSNSQYGVTHYYDQLREGAFGNYRDLLETVTLSPVMGIFLSMAGNQRADEQLGVRPDENYAREVRQLFSIGLHELNIDGTEKKDAAGLNIPTYDQALVEEFARVFTGWELPNLRRWRDTNLNSVNKLTPMTMYPEYHDNGAKTLLRGEAVPANLSPEEDLQRALDNLFNHPNVGPFICRQLIQRLVTSTPTPPYVARVAGVFNNNGAGVRGDLRAVVRAILLDSEARTGHTSITGYGKLREPILRITHLWRSFNVQPAVGSERGNYKMLTPYAYNLDSATGQAVLRAPSVFNFYDPKFAPPGPVRDAGLQAPEFQLATENNIIDTTNRLGSQVQRFQKDANTSLAYLDLDREINLASEPDALLEHLNLLLLSGSMSSEMRTILRGHIEALPSDAEGLRQRAADAITIIVVTPDYLIQK